MDTEILVRVASKDYSSAGPGILGAAPDFPGLTVVFQAAKFIEWKVQLPQAGLWYLHAEMTAGNPRPCSLRINGELQAGAILDGTTGGWQVSTLKWFQFGPYAFHKGENMFRIEFPGPIPHLKTWGFSLAELEQKSVPSLPETPPPAPQQEDDLKVIEGIGPKISELLIHAGFGTFALLAGADPSRIREILLAGGRRFSTADPASWPVQAKLALEGRWEELYALQARLKGGRGEV